MTSSASNRILAESGPITAGQLTQAHLDVLQMQDIATLTRGGALLDADDDLAAGRRDSPAIATMVAEWNARCGRRKSE